MKKIWVGILAAISVLSMSMSAFAAGSDTTGAAPTYTIIAGEQVLDLSGLPRAPYPEGGTIMVPLRRIAEALGYQVGWDPETGAVTVEDAYIQKAILFDGTEQLVFEGKLQIIDMSRKINSSAKTMIHNGYTYVPLEFFDEFLNDTAIEGTTITVRPSMCEVQTQHIV